MYPFNGMSFVAKNEKRYVTDVWETIVSPPYGINDPDVIYAAVVVVKINPWN